MSTHTQADYKTVVAFALDTFKRKFDYFVKHVTRMEELFEVSFSAMAETHCKVGDMAAVGERERQLFEKHVHK